MGIVGFSFTQLGGSGELEEVEGDYLEAFQLDGRGGGGTCMILFK